MRGNGRAISHRMRPDESSIREVSRETTVCYSYMCPFAYGCMEKSARPAQVLMRRCMRYQPESVRIAPGLSDQALDLLARQRDRGVLLAPATAAILDQHRPDGPLRK